MVTRLFSRLVSWANPQLPPFTPVPVSQSTLDSRAALAIERYASIAGAMATIQLNRPIWPDRDPSVYDTQGYRAISLIFRCVSIIAHAAGTAPLRVYDEAQDDDPIDDHPLRQLVRQPNPTQGEALFWGNVTVRAAIAGFCVAEKERNGLGGVIALNPLRSSWLKAIPIGRGVYDWEYRIPGVATPYRLKAADVVVFRWADTPDGSPYGLGPLASAIRSAALLAKMADMLGTLFDRGGVPLYGLIPNPDLGRLSQVDADAMLEAFIQRRGGVGRAGVPMILGGIIDVKKLQMDLDELAYTDLRDVQELEICQAFGVPARKAGTRVGLEHTTQNATASVEDGEFYRDVIVPLWTRYDDAATTSLLPDFEQMPTTRYLGFDTSDIQALQEDRNAKAPWMIQGFSAGAFTQHTIYRELGIPLPETDDFYLRSIAVEAIPADDPLGLMAAMVTTTTTATPTTTTTPAPQLGTIVIREITAGDGPDSRLTRRHAIGNHNRKAIAKIADARAKPIAAFLSAQAERIARTVAAPVGVGLVAVRNGHTTERLALRDVRWEEEETLLLAELIRLYLLAGETAFSAAADQLDITIDWSFANPRVKAMVDRLGHRIVGITEETRKAVADIVTNGLDAGKGLPEIADEVKAAGAFSDARAMTLARTESMTAFGHASALAFRESGVVDRIQCFDSPTHCDDYGAADGLSCCDRNGLVDTLDSAELHLASEHPNGSLAIAPVLVGEE